MKLGVVRFHSQWMTIFTPCRSETLRTGFFYGGPCAFVVGVMGYAFYQPTLPGCSVPEDRFLIT
jgi:hypothetical protein